MKEFFGALRRAAGPASIDIIEKDYHLHRLLHSISESGPLSESLVFKGGTCLVKAYAGYFRFSEDIDFTRRQDRGWREKTGSRPEKHCSSEITAMVREFKRISDGLGLRFSGDKSRGTPKGGDVDIRGRGKMFDIWLSYRSEVLEIPVKIKVQVNLMDRMEFPVASMPLRSYVDGVDMEGLRAIYGDACTEYLRRIVFPCYDAREIFTEKCRAAMTRIVSKPRDVLDIYMMERRFGYSIAEYREPIIRKTEYMLDMYAKYRKSLKSKEFPDEHVLAGAEEKLILDGVPASFDREAVRIHGELRSLREEILFG